MKRHIELTVLLTLGLFFWGILSSSVLANQESEKKPLEVKNTEKASAPDEMAEILEHYFAIRDLLAHDKTEDLTTEAKEMSKRLEKLVTSLQAIGAAADSFKAEDLKRAREDFASLSETVLNHIKNFGFSGTAYSFRCDMAKESWLQEHDQIGNPYYGSQMYRCGKVTGMIENGRYLEKK